MGVTVEMFVLIVCIKIGIKSRSQYFENCNVWRADFTIDSNVILTGIKMRFRLKLLLFWKSVFLIYVCLCLLFGIIIFRKSVFFFF